MAVRVSEAFILRTYPFGEADSIVSFFTRDAGRLRGVAKRARRPKGPFGSTLERMSHVRAEYYQRETRELVTFKSCELIQSAFDLRASYDVGVGLDVIAEIADHLLPPDEPNERYFRLLIAVMDFLREQREAGLWPAVLYFALWSVRLSGFLPELRVEPESRQIAEEMLARRLRDLTPRSWTPRTAADLRRLLVRGIEHHVERKLVTVPILESL